ncbi:L,D-transpeptidase family protein [Flavihumibacter sp. CACIAM 22H1]|uniref:L,D-transpeptidase family protein n=1 Tax=Flavihumibacter sp. CACIAM 22H1 TaxID=1812911 RepID=UPI000AB76711|nr:L,D-transpeptidase family protein [Flavihumibacter sp. CACIAM 22H1]
MKKISITLFILSWVFVGYSQTAYPTSFAEYQRNFPRLNDILRKKEDSLRRQFNEKGLSWPAKYIYLRSFKYDSQLEVWVKNEKNQPFQLFKTYKVCAMAGTLGPKRMEGDYQVPEGFYYINEFNPRSVYHLSLGLNYPNASDRFLSDAIQPGGDIYIHGSCVTTGCIPITDSQIEELYVLATYAKSSGQDFIPVHIYPVRFDVKKSADYLGKYVRDFADYAHLANSMKEVFYYFEKYKKLPVIMVNNRGSYVLDQEVKNALPSAEKKSLPVPVLKKKRHVAAFDESEIPTTVHKLPEFPGGADAFKQYLRDLNNKLSTYLNEEQHTAYILVEFIVNNKGKVLNPRIIRGGNDLLNEHLLDALEIMPDWLPAVREGKLVPMKLKQTIVVEKTGEKG